MYEPEVVVESEAWLDSRVGPGPGPSFFEEYKDFQGFPDSSVGNESACNVGDPCSIPGLGRSAGEGIGYPLQYSWASLVAQLVKNLPAMWEIWA